MVNFHFETGKLALGTRSEADGYAEFSGPLNPDIYYVVIAQYPVDISTHCIPVVNGLCAVQPKPQGTSLNGMKTVHYGFSYLHWLITNNQ